jgi:hypothetical protein
MKAFLLLAALLLTGCDSSEPRAARPAPLKSDALPNHYVISTLFEHDGCAMYRFYDEGYPRYFAKCGKPQSVTSEQTVSCGKGCSRRVITTTVEGDGK